MLSNESRQLLVEAYEKNPDAKMLAEIFQISVRSVYRIVEQYRNTGSVRLRTSQRGRKRKLSEEDKQKICDILDEKPDTLIREIHEELGLDVCEETIRLAVVALGYTRKKKVIHAAEQERPRRSRKT